MQFSIRHLLLVMALAAVCLPPAIRNSAKVIGYIFPPKTRTLEEIYGTGLRVSPMRRKIVATPEQEELLRKLVEELNSKESEYQEHLEGQ